MAAARPTLGTVPLGSGAPFFPRPLHAPQGLAGTRHVVPFYMHPSPPYLPCQYPVPIHIPCSPHFGLPTMGLGMAMLPNPYMDVPGYVLQSSQFPLTDFRQVVDPSLMNLYPQRFRPPNPGSMQVVSSGVQTEPPAAVKHVTNSDMKSESGRGTDCAASGSPLTSPGSSPQTSVYLQPDNQACLGNEGYVTQEDIRRACGEILPKGVCLHVPLAGMSALTGSAGAHSAQGDCGPADGAAFAYRRPLHSSSHCTDADVGGRQVPGVLAQEESQSSSLEGHEREGASAPDLSPVHVKSSVWEKEEEEEQASDAEDEMFKIVRLPFDGQFVAAWREMAEQSVWSVGSLPSLVPSPQWLARHGLASGENGSADAEACAVCSKPGDDVSLVVAVTEERQQFSTSSDSLPPYVPAASWLSEFRHVHCCGWPIPGARECCIVSRGRRGRQRSHTEQQKPQLHLGKGFWIRLRGWKQELQGGKLVYADADLQSSASDNGPKTGAVVYLQNLNVV